MRYRIVDKGEITQLNPVLNDIYHKGVLIDDSFALDNPAEAIRALVRLFVEGGGKLLQQDIVTVEAADDCVRVNGQRYDRCIIRPLHNSRAKARQGV